MDKTEYLDIDLRPFNRYSVLVYKELPDGCLITENFPYVFQQELNNTNDNDFFNLFIGEILDEFTEPNCIVRVEVQLNEKNVIVMN